MLTIIDKYILKKYLTTFGVMLGLFAPIGIVIDVSEKINKMIENKIPIVDILIYYYHFTIYEPIKLKMTLHYLRMIYELIMIF